MSSEEQNLEQDQIQDLSGDGATAEEMTRAKEMGWADKTSWRGAAEEFVGAKAFLEKSESVLPIVRAHNKELRERAANTDREVAQLKQELRNATTLLQTIQEERHDDSGEQLEVEKADLKVQIAQANRDGEYDKAADLTDKLTDVNLRMRDHAAKATAGKGGNEGKDGNDDNQGRVHPDVQQFYKDNPEFISNKRISRLSVLIGQELREEGSKLIGKDFMDEVKRRTLAEVGGNGGSGNGSRVNGGNGGSGRGGSGGEAKKGYGELPQDAKVACDDPRNDRFWKDGKRYKDQNAWRSAYAEKYHAQG